MSRHATLLMVAVLLAFTVHPIASQGQCPPVDSILPPVDPNAFALVQPYAVRSVRHEGRYHAGEDWALPDGTSQGQSVRAVANGRVIYSYPDAWGMDGGVVILEHELPDERLLYTLYGHLAESDTVRFPAGEACVSAGDVVGVIGDARPAPHLHFETRISNGRAPNTGYTDTLPDAQGYRAPSVTLQNEAARLRRSVAWVTTLDERSAAPPLVLNDNSLLILAGDSVRRVLPDGRLYWRTRLPQPAVALSALQGRSLIHYPDGTIQVIDAEGQLGEAWLTDTRPIAPPFALDAALVFPSADGTLAALDNRRRAVTWSASVSIDAHAAVASRQLIALRDDASLVVVTHDGTPISRAHFSPHSDIIAAEDGTLIAYTRTGLWRVLTDGAWVAIPQTSIPVDTPRALLNIDGTLWTLAGHTLITHTDDGPLIRTLPIMPTDARLFAVDGRAVVLTDDGHLITPHPNEAERLCTIPLGVAAHTGTRASMWAELNTDGVLRIAIGHTLAGVDWARLLADCG